MLGCPDQTGTTVCHWPTSAESSTASQTAWVARASRKVGLVGWPLARLEEVGHLVHEGVLVADLEAGHPPVLHVGMVAVGDVDRLPAPEHAGVAVVEVLEPVEVVEVPLQRGLLAVDLEGVERLVAAGVAGRLEEAERAVLEPAEERAGVVDLDRLDLAGQVVLALLDERLGHGGDGGDGAVEPEGRVDAVGQQVAGDARAGGRGVEPPERGAPLGEVGRDGPVLEEVRPVVEDPAEPALVDELLGERHGRGAPVVVPDGVGHAGRLDGLDHRASLDEVIASGFSQRTILPALAAAMAISACVSFGVQMSIASMSLRSMSFRQSVSTDS